VNRLGERESVAVVRIPTPLGLGLVGFRSDWGAAT